MTKDPIKKAKDGTYYFRAYVGVNPVTGAQIQPYRSGFKTKKEARSEYSKIMLTKADEYAQTTDTGLDMSFQEFMNTIYIPYYKSTVKESTFEKHFPYFYKLKVSEIEAIHIQRWQIKLTQMNLKPSYIRGIQGGLSLAFDRAVILGIAKENPCKIVGNVKKSKIEINFWTKDEFEKVLSFIYKEDYYQHFLFVTLWFLFMSGLRIGEAAALQWEDIDFETGIVSVNKNLYYKSQSEYKFVPTKTKASNRYLVLDSKTLALLKEWKDVQGLIITKPLTKTGFIFSYNGHPTQKSTFYNAVARYSKAAGVKRISIHGFRHSHASLLISLGENPLIIKERLGHEDIETTLGTYGHLYPHTNFEVASKLNGIINDETATENTLLLPKNQFTAQYQHRLKK